MTPQEEKERIQSIQDKLVGLNMLGKQFKTGTNNPQTIAAVKELQTFIKVPVTGFYDLTTEKKLNQEWKKDKWSTIFRHFNPSTVKTNFKDKNEIFSIQDMLIKTGILTAKDRTGVYDKRTFDSVKIIQNLLNLRPTGIFDEELKSAIPKNQTIITNALRPYNLLDNQGGALLWDSLKQNLKPSKLPTDNSFLIYDGNNLCWINNNQIVKKWRALSGKFMWKDITPERVKSEAGPLPPGRYGLGQVQKMKYKRSNYTVLDVLKYNNRSLFYTDPDWHGAIDFVSKQKEILTQIGWGQFRLPIIGKKFGRSQFYIHGGALIGSSGCIDLGDQGMEDFAETLTATYGSKKHSLFVLVFYGLSAEEILNNKEILSSLMSSTTDQGSEMLILKGREFLNKKASIESAAEQKRKEAAEAERRKKQVPVPKEKPSPSTTEREMDTERNKAWWQMKNLFERLAGL